MRKHTYLPSGPTIVAQAPCRADLAGGTIDLWPLYLFHPGALTLNFAVNILTTCRVTPLKGRGIYLRSLDTKKEEHFESLDELRATKKFRLPISARLLQFFSPKEGALVETDSRFVLAYTGVPRKSGINNWEVFKSHINGDKRVFRNFERIAAIARSMHQALVAGDWDGVARLLREEWKLRRSNAPGISTPLIDKLIAVAGKHGGKAAKVCGAGGGGCVIFLVEKGAASRVATAVGDAGGRVLPLQVARDGLRVAPVVVGS